MLLIILLFNWVGYRLLTSFLEVKANNQLETALDNNDFEESQLISIKVPVSYLPYYNNSSTFERVDGQVEIQGVVYKYVKRRIYNDSLEMLCIANPAVTKLKAAKDEFFRFLNDLQHNGSEKSSQSHHGLSKSFSPDYYAVIQYYRLDKLYTIITAGYFRNLIHLSSSHHLIVEQPPEYAG